MSTVDSKKLVEDQDLYSGLIRLHVPHHAMERSIFGLGKIEEPGRHGYRVSAGTLYPLLHQLETKGYLSSPEVRHEKSRRKVYRATALGLAAARSKVHELFHELMEATNASRTARAICPPQPRAVRGPFCRISMMQRGQEGYR